VNGPSWPVARANGRIRRHEGQGWKRWRRHPPVSGTCSIAQDAGSGGKLRRLQVCALSETFLRDQILEMQKLIEGAYPSKACVHC
jgi:hypothetical protein